MKVSLRTILPLLLVPALMTAPAFASVADLPDWVTEAAAAKVQVPEGAHPKAAVLLEDTLLTVGADGQITERYREVIKILRPQGREYAHPVAWFNKDHKLLSFHVWSIGPDGHQYTLKNDQIYERGTEEWGILYNDVRYKSAEVPGSDPGGVVAYEYTQQMPTYAGSEPWEFQNPIPTVKSVFEIDLPQGWQHRALWRKYTRVEPTEVAPNHFLWQLTDIPGIDLESVPMAPAEEALAGRMEVYFSANALPEGEQLWTRIGEWYTQLAAPQSEGPADITAASRGLTSSHADFVERIQKVATFMQQQIRYVGVEIGIGGFIPHSAEEVYRNHYGDCKDKATLMIAMLDAVGVRATWVLVDTERGVIDAKVPSRMANHMIAAIEIPKGYDNPALKAVVTAKSGKRYLIFDPTNQYVPIGLLPTYLQGGTGLLMAGADSEAITLPVLNPESDTVNRTATFTLAADGSLTGSVTVKRLGASADQLRWMFVMTSDKEKRQELEDALRSDFSSFQVDGEEIENARELDQQLILSYSLTASSYAKNAGSLLLVRPRVISSDAFALTDERRKFPIEFASTGDWHDAFDVKIPTGYTVDDLPDPVALDTAFASYHSDVKADGDVLHYSREYIVKKLELDADDYATLRKFESEIYTDENRSAVLKKTN
jgi:transglutaminase-like putative cysteine protease